MSYLLVICTRKTVVVGQNFKKQGHPESVSFEAEGAVTSAGCKARAERSCWYRALLPGAEAQGGFLDAFQGLLDASCG